MATGRANACECFSIDSLSANELMNEVEFVVIGHAIRNVGVNSEVNSTWDQRGRGYNVLIEIDSVIKGDINSKTLIIRQFGGSCDQMFEFDEQYLIVGNQLENFVNGTPKRDKDKEGEIPPTSMPPQPPSVHSKTATFYESSDEEVIYWNALANHQIILNTSICSSFLLDTGMHATFWQLNTESHSV